MLSVIANAAALGFMINAGDRRLNFASPHVCMSAQPALVELVRSTLSAQPGFVPKGAGAGVGVTLEDLCDLIEDDPLLADSVLGRLGKLGVLSSVDDFGTGHSSLSNLQSLPVSEVKIDKSFVQGMIDNDAAATIVRSIVSLGHNLGLKVVAEGVESEREQALLSEMGCDLGQGYLYGKPMTGDDVIELLSGPALELVAGTDVDGDTSADGGGGEASGGAAG